MKMWQNIENYLLFCLVMFEMIVEIVFTIRYNTLLEN